MRGVKASMVAALVAVAGVSGTTPPSAAAQESRIRTECRCVDREGKEIRNCTCLRTPRAPEGWARGFLLGPNRARLGITVDPDQPEDVDARGARVDEVLDDGPADRAGLREGDIITHVDGHSLFEPLDADVEEDFDLDESVPVQRLLAIARRLEPGEEVEIRYLRDGREGVVTVEAEDLEDWGARAFAPRMEALGERLRDLGDRLRAEGLAAPGGEVRIWRDEEGPEVRVRRFGPGGGVVVLDDERFSACPGEEEAGEESLHVLAFGDACLGGVELVDLKPGLAEYFGVDRGVLVADVHEDSPLGLEPGDVILRIGDREATSPERVRRILRSYEPDEDIHMRIVRRGDEMEVVGRLSSPD